MLIVSIIDKLIFTRAFYFLVLKRMNVHELIGTYDMSNIHIATISSHTALQIFHGARLEGFRTVAIVEARRKWFYENFSNLIDEFITVNSWSDICKPDIINKLRSLNSILIPHGSYVEYVGLECVKTIPIPIFGLRSLFEVEANQKSKMWLLDIAGIKIPRSFDINDPIDRPVIIKLPGAKGGRGYFIATTLDEVRSGVNELIRSKVISSIDDVLIQEYIIGVPAYFHYFYSPIFKRIELLGMDIRYESNVDGLHRLPPKMLAGISPSFNVVGNIPLVLRESMLPNVMEYGIKFAKATQSHLPPGIIGPYSLESIIKDNGEIIVFEFSGRIVAGTNLYINGSPYSWLYWNEPMSTGRRIAREIKLAIEEGSLYKVVT